MWFLQWVSLGGCRRGFLSVILVVVAFLWLFFFVFCFFFLTFVVVGSGFGGFF